MTDDRARFGKYELVELLGEGGMASVYRAVLFGPGGFRKQVALKLIRSHIAQDDKMVQLMFNEARLGGHLRHKNIVEVYEFDKVRDTYYLAIEFVDGYTLADILPAAPEGEYLPPRIVANVAMQICQALAYAHAAVDDQGHPMHLVHRDLKPANVMVRRDGVVKLADFGIAKADTNVTHTTTGLARGTPAYMSPEQVTGARQAPLDHRSDLFSLGAIVAELLTGERTFGDEGMLDLMNCIAAADVAETLDRVAQRAMPLMPALRRALQRLPADRYPDAAEMGQDIRRVYDKLPPSEERLSAWLIDWMGEGDQGSIGTPPAAAFVGDDARVSPTPDSFASRPAAETRPATVVGTPAAPLVLPDDAKDTLETQTTPVGVGGAGDAAARDSRTDGEAAPGTRSFFQLRTDGGGEAEPETEARDGRGATAEKAAPLEVRRSATSANTVHGGGPEPPDEKHMRWTEGPGAPEPPRSPRPRPTSKRLRPARRRQPRQAGSVGHVPVVSVRSTGGASRGFGAPSRGGRGSTWAAWRVVLLVIALAVALAVPALALKVLQTADPDTVMPPDRDGITVDPAEAGGEVAAGARPADRKPPRGVDRGKPPGGADGAGQRGGKADGVDASPDTEEVDEGGSEEELEIPASTTGPGLDALGRNKRLGRCLRKHRREAGPPLEVTVEFVVAPDGAVSEAQVQRASDLNPGLRECLVQGLERMRLPQAAGAEDVLRSYTFLSPVGHEGP